MPGIHRARAPVRPGTLRAHLPIGTSWSVHTRWLIRSRLGTCLGPLALWLSHSRRDHRRRVCLQGVWLGVMRRRPSSLTQTGLAAAPCRPQRAARYHGCALATQRVGISRSSATLHHSSSREARPRGSLPISAWNISDARLPADHVSSFSISSPSSRKTSGTVNQPVILVHPGGRRGRPCSRCPALAAPAPVPPHLGCGLARRAGRVCRRRGRERPG